MDTVVRKKFENQDIVIDGKTTYINCSFTKCHFFYSGGDFPFMDCKVLNPTITFTGEAGKTLAFMQMIGMVKPPIPKTAPAVQLPESGGVH